MLSLHEETGHGAQLGNAIIEAQNETGIKAQIESPYMQRALSEPFLKTSDFLATCSSMIEKAGDPIHEEIGKRWFYREMWLLLRIAAHF